MKKTDKAELFLSWLCALDRTLKKLTLSSSHKNPPQHMLLSSVRDDDTLLLTASLLSLLTDDNDVDDGEKETERKERASGTVLSNIVSSSFTHR
jgi:hypothetical protein